MLTADVQKLLPAGQTSSDATRSEARCKLASSAVASLPACSLASGGSRNSLVMSRFGAQRIAVRMTGRDDGLSVEIHDDGIGVAADTNPSGVGLASMTERATELGGWCTNEIHRPAAHGLRPGCPILLEGSAGAA